MWQYVTEKWNLLSFFKKIFELVQFSMQLFIWSLGAEMTELEIKCVEELAGLWSCFGSFQIDSV